MTNESSNASRLSVAMTTTGMMQITGENTTTPPSSHGVEFYFHCALVVIGVVGTATNGLILYALVASKQHKKHVLIVNQNVLDLFTCFFMAVIYSLKLGNVHLGRSVGYWLCTLLLSEWLIYCGSVGAVINLASITVERYLKVVHSTWSKTKLRGWMMCSVAAFSWIGAFTYQTALLFSTTAVIDGTCYAYTIWSSDTARLIQFSYSFLSFYVIILLIFIFCYWRILADIRRRASVMASHAAAGSSTGAEAQYHKMQSNVSKTMLFVCSFYAISWLPFYIYMLNAKLNPKPRSLVHVTGFYASLTITFLYMCTNPFVYAIKFDPVKEVLLRLIPCKKNNE